MDTCEMCGRDEPTTEHHLIPKAVHTKKRFIKRFGKKEMKSRKAMLCKLCHDGIHDLVEDEKELANDYNTVELLMADERVVKHVEWVKKQK